MAVVLSLVAAIATGWAGPAGAALTWDANGTGDGQPDGGGAWLGTGQWWDGAANQDWVSGSDANFGNGGVGGTVTLAVPTTVNSLAFNTFTSTYTLGTAGQAITLNTGLTMNSGAGAVTIVSPITLGGAQSWTNNSASLLTVSGDVTNGGNLLTVSGTGNTAISGIIGAGAGGLTKSGTGTVTLSNTNTYTGQTTVTLGTLSASATDALGTGAALLVNGGTLDISTFSSAVGAVTLTSGSINGSTGTLTGASFAVESGSVSAILAGAAAPLTKTGTGTATLNGAAANTYTGATTVNRGMLIVDFANMTAPTNLIDSGSALVMGSGTIQIKQKNATVTSQTFNGTTINAGASTIQATNAGGSATLTLTAALGALARNVGGVVNFTLPTSGQGAITTSTGNDPTGFLGRWATTGLTTAMQYAANSGGNVIAYTVATPATAGTLGNMSSDTTNYSFGASATIPNGSALTGNTLRSSAGGTLEIGSTAGNTNTLALNGLMNAGGGALTVQRTGAGAGATGGLVIGASNELVIVTNNQGVTISAPIKDGAGSGAVTFASYGGGGLTLSNANNFSGGLTIASGQLNVGGNLAVGSGTVTLMPGTSVDLSNAALPNSFTINDASLVSGNSFGSALSGPITISGVATIGFTGEGNSAINSNISGSGGLTANCLRLDTLTYLSGTNTYTGPTTIGAGGIAAAVKFTNRVSLYNADTGSWTADKIIVNPGAVAVFAVGGTTQFTSSDITTLAALGTATGGFMNGSFIGLDTATASYACDSVIGNPNGGANKLSVYKFGANTLTLSGASSYTGQTRIYRGALRVSSINSVVGGTASSNMGAPKTVDDGTIIMGLYGQAGTLIYAGSGETTDRVIALNNAGGGGGSSGATIDQSGTGLLKFTSELSIGTLTAKTITFQGSTSGTGEFAGAIGGTGIIVTKAGTGVWTLSGANTYTGATNVNGGVLRVTNSITSSTGVAVSGGALGGNGSVSPAVTVSSTGGVNLVDGSVGTLTLGSTLAITGAAGANNLAFDLGAAGAGTDKITVAGATTVTTAGAAVINLNQLGGVATPVTPGTYTLIQGTGAMAAVGQFALATSKAFGESFTLGVVGNNLQVTTAAGTTGPTTPAWAGTTALWATPGNWVGLSIPGYQSNVTFDTAAGTLSTTLNQDFDINSLTFGLNSTLAITIAKGTAGMLTLEASSANGNTTGNGITVNTPSSGTPTQTISANVGLASSQTWTVNSGAALTVSGVVSDFNAGYSLTKDGAGTLTLSGNNTYWGATTINNGKLILSGTNSNAGTTTIGVNGTLQIGAGAGAGAPSASNIVNDGALVLNRTGTLTISSIISGTGTVTQLATGTTVLSSPLNSYTGTTTISGGAIQATDGSGLPAASFLSLDGGVWQPNGAAAIFTRSLGTSGASKFQMTGNGTNGSGFLANGAQLTINIGGNSTPSTIQWGTAPGDVGSKLVGTLQLGSSNAAYNAVFQNPIDLNAATRTIYVNSNTGEVSGVIGTTTGTAGLTKTGTGTLKLSGANTYNGATTITAGTINLGIAEVAGTSGPLGNPSTPAGSIIFGGGTLQYSTVNLYDYSARFTATGTNDYKINTNSLNVAFANALAASGTGGLTKAGVGTLTLPVANLYTGTTTVSGGRLAYGISNAILTGPVTVNGAGAILDLGTFSDSVGLVTLTAGDIFGSGTLTGTGTFTPNNAGTSTVTANLAGSVGLTKTGAGLLVLSGANTYTGATTLTAGSIMLAAAETAGTSGPLGNPSTVANSLSFGGGTLIYSPVNQADYSARITATSGTAYRIDTNNQNVTFATGLPAVGANALVKIGPGTLTLTGASLYTGATTVQAGTLTLNRQTGSLAATSALTFNAGGGTFNMDNATATGALTQGLGALTFSAGDGTVKVTRTEDLDQKITFASLAARVAGATGNFVTTGAAAPSATNGFVFTAAPAAGALIDRGLFYNGSSYAAYDAGGFIRGYNSGDASYLAAPTGATIGTSTSTSNVDLTTGDITAQTTASANTINLRNSSLTMSAAGQILSANGILSSGSSGATLGIATKDSILEATAAGNEVVIRVDGGTDGLTLNSIIRNQAGGTTASKITKTGAGALTLTGANSFTGGFYLDAGRLNINSALALGNSTGSTDVSTAPGNPGTLLVNDGTTIANTSGSALNLSPANNIATTHFNMSWNGSITFAGTNGTTTTDLYFGPMDHSNDSTVTLLGNTTMNVTGGIFNAGTHISGAFTLTKNGPGELQIGNSNNNNGNFSGTLIVNEGTFSGNSNSGTQSTFGTQTVLLGDTATGSTKNATLAFYVPGNNGTPAYASNSVIVRAGSSGVLALINKDTSSTGTHGFAGYVQLNNNLTLASIALTGGIPNTLEIQGPVYGSGNLRIGDATYTNVGTVTLSGANMYTGTTTINSGTLKLTTALNNNIASSPKITVGSGAILDVTGVGIGVGGFNVVSGQTLAGSGTVNGAVTVSPGGILAPGSSIGTLRIASLTMAATSIYDMEIGASLAADKVVVTGDVSLTAGWKVLLEKVGGAAPKPSDQYDLFSYTGAATLGLGAIDKGSTGWIVTGASIVNDAVAKRIYITGIASIIPGDTNNDKVVDAFDFITLKKNFGGGVGGNYTVGNFDDAGTVDWADLNTLTNGMAGTGSTSAVTPEPATLGLLAIGALALLRRRRA
jgi:autotransporter-associated beta strand protein